MWWSRCLRRWSLSSGLDRRSAGRRDGRGLLRSLSHAAGCKAARRGECRAEVRSPAPPADRAIQAAPSLTTSPAHHRFFSTPRARAAKREMEAVLEDQDTSADEPVRHTVKHVVAEHRNRGVQQNFYTTYVTREPSLLG